MGLLIDALLSLAILVAILYVIRLRSVNKQKREDEAKFAEYRDHLKKQQKS